MKFKGDHHFGCMNCKAIWTLKLFNFLLASHLRSHKGIPDCSEYFDLKRAFKVLNSFLSLQAPFYECSLIPSQINLAYFSLISTLLAINNATPIFFLSIQTCRVICCLNTREIQKSHCHSTMELTVNPGPIIFLNLTYCTGYSLYSVHKRYSPKFHWKFHSIIRP